MLIQPIFMHNPLRNFNYVIACEKTHEALVIDPLDASYSLAFAQEHHLRITQIVNTHDHSDHTAGNGELVAATGAIVMVHEQAMPHIPYATRGLRAGDIISVGSSVQLTVLDTPGHTMAHVCLFANSPQQHALFSGDTLFNGGCGNCHSGDVHAMYHTVTEQLAKLPDDTKLYPGHEYLENNLGFALKCEPDNLFTQQLITDKVWQNSPYFVTTLGLEKQISPFFRLANPQIVARLQIELDEKGDGYSKKDIFIRLRKLRDNW